MPEIRKLSDAVINKIAAGEVIERPASVVKELLENAVDAGSTQIDVTVEQGGAQLVRVSDNGCGMTADQLHLAVTSHATSKIRDAEDLFSVATLGFRGEALASIAEVSQFRLRSRAAGSDAGSQLEVLGGQLSDITPCGCPVGTVVEVAHLFCNTPVRRKFLKTTQTELGHVSEAFLRIALAHPDVHFTLRHNTRVIHDLPRVDRWKDRIVGLFGRELAEGLIWVESTDDAYSLSGYAADPQFSRGNNRLQYLLLNGRHIRDRSLQHALGEAYRGLLLTGRFPIVFLRLDMPADAVDVNVHPTKLEVRFQDAGRLYSQLLGTLRRKFLASDLTARVADEERRDGAGGHDPEAAEAHRQRLASWARSGEKPAAPAGGGTATHPLSRPGAPAVHPPGAAGSIDPTARQSALGLRFETPATVDGSLPGAATTTTDGQPGGAAKWIGPAPTHPASPGLGPAGPGEIPPARAGAVGATVEGISGLQLQDRYLVTESGDGIVVIDQHALHERVLYEQIREKTLAGKLETQRLLVPEPVSLSPAEAAAAWDARENLAQLGIQIEQFGGDTLLVTTYPAMLANLGPGELLRQCVDLLMTGGPGPQKRDLFDELLHMVSCKAAVKAGDRLSREEVSALLEQRHLCQDAHHCPHGRPTALVFSRAELDKRFQRT